MENPHVNFLERETEYIRPRYTRVIFFILGVLILIGIAGCTYTLTKNGTSDEVTYDPVTLEPIEPKGLLNKIKHFIFSKDVKLEGARNDRINFLITGQGGPGHDGPFLTDTIILASIKPSTGQIAFVSIPRDLYVSIPGYGERKINHANAFGEAKKEGYGPELSKQVVEQILDEEIHYVVRVDFQAFVDLIDAVGGVSVNVERSFIDYEYPAPNYQYQTISFQKGTQIMDGEKALMFVRSRHGNNGEGSDFARSQRQQKLLLALKEKMLSFSTVTNPLTMKDIFNSLSDNVVTNMEFSDILAMLKLSKELNTKDIITLTLDNGPNGYLENATTADGAFILLPVGGTFDTIQYRVEHIFEEPPAITEDTTPVQQEVAIDHSTANIEIKNATWRAGLAARVKQQLEQSRFTVSNIGNTAERPQEKSAIYVLTNSVDPVIVTALAETLNISSIEKTPPIGETTSSTTNILVILGDDFNE